FILFEWSDLAPWLLFGVLAGSFWGSTVSVPVLGHNTRITEQCITSTQTLLQNITKALAQETPFKGINCTRGMELNTATQMVSVCMPRQSTCSGFSNTDFDQDKCLKNIEKDLRCYGEMMLGFHPELLEHTVLNFAEIKQNCFALSLGDRSSQQDTEGCASAQRLTTHNPFDERVQLCKVLKGLQVRTITINRVIGYIHAGEYM
ncbi:interleukin-12 subunit alpha, partial [Esox lucius]|uniref:interleukin-12 subunit alpha n=1 Tax=Esox lucius TaxID=8010 RepID=UPI001476AB99